MNIRRKLKSSSWKIAQKTIMTWVVSKSRTKKIRMIIKQENII